MNITQVIKHQASYFVHEHAMSNYLQVEATGSVDRRRRRWLSDERRVVLVRGHFGLQPDLLKLRDAEAPLRLPRLVDGGSSLAPPGPRSRPRRRGGGSPPAPLHAVPKVACTHGLMGLYPGIATNRQDLGRRRLRNGGKKRRWRKRRSWVVSRGPAT